MGTVIRRRLQGVAFLVTLVLLLGLAVAQYNKVFTEVARVTLETDTIGNQLRRGVPADVAGGLQRHRPPPVGRRGGADGAGQRQRGAPGAAVA